MPNKRARVAACVVVAAGVMTACLPLPATATYQWGHGVLTPTLLTGQHAVKGEIGIDAGKVGNMAINANGTVEAWQLAWGPPGPYQMPVLSSVVQVEDGDDDFVFLEAPSGISPGVCPKDTSVWTVGPNMDGDLGLGDPNNDLYTTPQQVTTLSGLGIVEVAAAGTHMFAVTCTGTIYEWGDNLQGDLALPTNIRNITAPVVSTDLSSLTGGSSVGVQITTGSYASALLVRGQAYGWGENDLAQCGCGSTAKVLTTPMPAVQHGVAFSSIDAGGNLYNGHTITLDTTGTPTAGAITNKANVVSVAPASWRPPLGCRASRGWPRRWPVVSTPCSWTETAQPGPVATTPSARSGTAQRSTSSLRSVSSAE